MKKHASCLPVWQDQEGSVIACAEKIKVMRENFDELYALAQDALEDGLLMGVSEVQMREVLHMLVNQLVNPYQKRE